VSENVGGQLLKKMIIAGANRLEEYKQAVDALNVFPIPDGDTGTNMSMTAIAAARELLPIESDRIDEVAKLAAGGALKGARGNSGVILSQMFRGFSKSLEGRESADCDDLADAFLKASETAYKAVMKPKEGTMLTVARVMAEAAGDFALDSGDVLKMFGAMQQAGREVLEKTPDMLPVLKQANVVDAGGMGLLYIFEGACEAAGGVTVLTNAATGADGGSYAALGRIDIGDIKNIYCTEFIIAADGAPEDSEGALLEYLETIGDSSLVVGDGEIIKVHVHTNNPGDALEAALRIGSLSSIKIENMLIQHTSLVNGAPVSPEIPADGLKETGFIAVSAGDGFKELFFHLDVDRVIEGGQTMNPSAEDFISAVNRLNAENVVIMPNNKNVILAAKQAAALCPGRNVYVLETRSVPQGLAAMISYMPDMNIARNIEAMNEAVSAVKTGYVACAVRDSVFKNRDIKEGDVIGILEDEIVAVATEVEEAARGLVDAMAEDDAAELISIYYGGGADEDGAEALRDYIDETYPGRETEVRRGGQPLYFYTISAE